MGAPHDLSAFLWPDVAHGRQPQLPVGSTRPIRALVDVAAVKLAGSPIGPTGNTLTPANGPNGRSLFRAASAGTFAQFPVSISIGTGDFTVAVDVELVAAEGASIVYALGSSASFFALALKHSSAGNNAALVLPGPLLINLGTPAVTRGRHRVIVSRSGSTVIWNVDGYTGTTTNSTSVPALTTLILGSYQASVAYGPANGAHWYNALIDTRAWSRQELSAWVAAPASVFDAPMPIPFWADAGANTNLSASATGQTTASAALTTGIPFVGAALSISGSSGTLTTGIPLAGASAAVAAASGEITTAITLGGAALAQAVSAALLSTGIVMTAPAVAQAAAQGTLATAIAMIGAAGAQASASGSLGGGSGLSGAGQAQASATAALTVQIRLDAAAIAQAAAAAGLTTDIHLGGDATAEATAGASLTTSFGLSAAALAQAIATGSLTVSVQLAGLAQALAGAGADLTAQISLGGSAAASASATGVLAAPVSVTMAWRLTMDTAKAAAQRMNVAIPTAIDRLSRAGGGLLAELVRRGIVRRF